jgi:hypothetical protein
MHTHIGIATAAAVALGIALASPATANAQSGVQPSSLTIQGCLQQTSDSPDAFVIRPSKESSAAWMGKAPIYRVSGSDLKAHAGHRVEVTGTVTTPKDEPGVDAALARITPEKTVVTTVDVKTAPILTASNVKMVAGNCTVGAWSAAASPSGITPGTTGSAVAATSVSIDDVSNNASTYYGKTIRVQEDVARVLGPRIFTLDEENLVRPGKDVLVIAPEGVTVKADDDVTVTGTVRSFVWTELEKELVDLDMKREWQLEFNARPVIIATSVEPTKK